ncbi:uncharacterized protein LACBIDRAFT_302607 [Laccaria bicolor S238N-H82]|uniref:Predicted protein n=1 Tax=Laccaria bicolor (strain S238N-H82 / ATCC MYA-4686) TaxID=486041 RepID=B0DHZ7_LACBS|nr:uncharacterized protein LACBIDRAFT_302607 [Laccaria bicolor S238N-H82]EDR05817.1 predicted protein [Laccaria bicolor S238N-H82]|eukprot:XP_001883493.1 predicted protein [Laccaria bicolor S238N-H82]
MSRIFHMLGSGIMVSSKPGCTPNQRSHIFNFLEISGEFKDKSSPSAIKTQQ